jgi:hypothetical protein
MNILYMLSAVRVYNTMQSGRKVTEVSGMSPDSLKSYFLSMLWMCLKIMESGMKYVMLWMN